MHCRYSIKKKKKNSGTTLIELIVASVLVSITAGIVLTIFHMFNKETTHMLLHAKLRIQSEIILEDIARNTRTHNNIRCFHDNYKTSKGYHNKAFSHIGFYTRSDINSPIPNTAYFFDNDTLISRTNGIDNKFYIGKDTVTINPNNSRFVLNDGNKLSAEIVLTNVHQNINHTLLLPKTHYRCRVDAE